MNTPVSGAESAVVRRLRQATVFATIVVMALIIRWVLDAPSTARIVAGALLAAPFAIGAPFLYFGHRRTYAWLTLALTPPLVLGLMEAVVAPPTRAGSTLLVFVVLATFVLCVAYLRATRPSSRP